MHESVNVNIYYILAVFFGAAALFFGYLGSTVDSQVSAEDAKRATQEQTEHIEGQLKDLGNKIQALHSSPPVSNNEKEIEQIQSKYNSIAEDFYKNLPVEVEEHRGRSATKTIQQLQRTRQIEAHVHKLEGVAQGLVSAFNYRNPTKPITINVSEFPVNLWASETKETYRTLLSFAVDSHWAIRFTWYPDRTPALEFTRMTSKDSPGKDRQFFLTTDSIQLVLLGEKFRPSLNQSISEDLKERVMKEIPKTEVPMEKFDEVAKGILETVIKHQLLQQSLKA